MEKRTFDLNLKEANRILLFDDDVLYAVENQKLSHFIYRWPDSGEFWTNINTALARLLEEKPTRFIELMNFSEDKELKKHCKEVYKSSRESISKKYNEIIKSTTLKLETLEKIIF